ncbi:MAG: tagatose 1,6-diphosphate aldolase [Pseudomonadota bacterium]
MDMIHGVAVDAGSGLEAAIRTARGPRAQADDLRTFKRCVLEALGTDASTVLVDATLGPGLLQHYPQGCTPMLAYEADVYHISDADRITVLPKDLRVQDYSGLGVKMLKFFMYYAPDDDPKNNARKQKLVAEVGQACHENGVKFLMEPLVYHPSIAPGTPEFADIKPELVRRSTALFAAPPFQVDVLKVEVPVDLAYVEGFGTPHISREAALEAFRTAAAPAEGCGLVYLSAGMAFDWFEAALGMAREAGVAFNGFMCGRAIWSDAVEVFGTHGEDKLRTWLEETGCARLKRLIAAVEEGD